MGDKIARAIVAFGVCVILAMAAICFGCKAGYDPNSIKGGDRFIVEQSSNAQTLFVDKETGVEYLWLHGQGDAVVVLVDENGKPLVKKDVAGVDAKTE